MTYRELLDKLKGLSDETLDGMDVCVEIKGEVFGARELNFAPEDDVLDKGHPFLTVNYS